MTMVGEKKARALMTKERILTLQTALGANYIVQVQNVADALGLYKERQKKIMDKLTANRYEKVSHPKIAHEDARGSILNIFQGPLEHVAVITRKAGSVFAEHWHPGENTQRMFLLSGRYRVRSVPLDESGNPIGEIKEFIAEAGDLTETGSYIGHAYEALEDCVFLNLNSAGRDPEGYGIHTIPLKTKLL